MPVGFSDIDILPSGLPDISNEIPEEVLDLEAQVASTARTPACTRGKIWEAVDRVACRPIRSDPKLLAREVPQAQFASTGRLLKLSMCFRFLLRTGPLLPAAATLLA